MRSFKFNHLFAIYFISIVGFIGCKKESKLATVSTPVANDITTTSAILVGSITDDGGSDITDKGFVWNTSPNPTTANTLVSSGPGSNNFTSKISGLLANTTYYVRAFASNKVGTAYSAQITFATPQGFVSDGSGITYSTIVIGEQEWMAENLRTTVYANGDPIPNITDNFQWSNLVNGAWAHFDNNNQYDIPYGKLYNGYAVMDVRNVCPTGWHVPSETDWYELTTYLGGMFIAGGRLKSVDSGWEIPNVEATNESGFSAVGGGYRSYLDGVFQPIEVGGIGVYWSSENQVRKLVDGSGAIYEDSSAPQEGASIRCVKD